MAELKRVSKLTITFLVDDNMEWMTKMPPGFTHELYQHIPRSEKSSPDQGSVPVLNFNDLCCGAHGFSALLETEVDDNPITKKYTLFDTGPDSTSLVRNIRSLQVPITKIDRVVTSHWHYDHTGGLLSFLKLRKACVEAGVTTPASTSDGAAVGAHQSVDKADECIVEVHPTRPRLRATAPAPTFKTVICALHPDPTLSEITDAGGLVETRKDAHTVADGAVWVSGEVPRVTEFEHGISSQVRWVEEGDQGWEKGGEEGIGPVGENATGRWIAEPHLMDERYAVVDVQGKGLVIFSSCSHAGIVNVIRDAVKTFNRPIHMVVGGLHLASAELYPRIEPTVAFLSTALRPPPTYILPMHCTGWDAKVALQEALGKGIIPAGVGNRVEVLGEQEDSSKMGVTIAE